MTRAAVPRLLAGLLTVAAVTVGPAVVGPAAGPAGASTATAAGSTAISTAAVATGKAASTPLRVSIASLAPATIPQSGPVRLSGRVTNRSKRTWTDLKVYLLTSAAPIRDRTGLARAAASAADTEVGGRRTADGLYDEIGDLAPGESATYHLSVGRAELGISGAPGVYWVGVHVLGAQDGDRDSVADGRARTFMPLLPPSGSAAGARDRTRLSLVVPVKEPVRRGAAARVLGLSEWNRTLSSSGRLNRLLRLSGRAGRPLTWVVDPAVLDAVQSLARKNPPLDTGPTGGRSPSGSPSGSPSPAAPSPDPDDTSAGGEDTGAESAAAALRARAWLDRFRRQAATHTVATVPYGDLDVAAVLDSPQRSLYQRATALSAAAMSGYGIDATVPVVAPIGGHLPATALRRVGSRTTLLLDDSALPRTDGVVARAPGQAPVVLADSSAGSGGPRPNAPYAALAVRQRLLSEAALHALSSRRDGPMVVTMPAYWDPGGAWERARFFAGLDQPWLQMVDLTSVTATASSSTGGGRPVYSGSERAAEVPRVNIATTDALTRTGTVFSQVLGNDTIDDLLARVALLGSSVTARSDPPLARSHTANANSYIRAEMARVHIEGPEFVMMSGESGPIQVTLVNDLDQKVTVGLAASTPGSDLRIAKLDPVTLGPGRRTSIQLDARSDDIGVHSVTLEVTDVRGALLGSSAQFSVRTSHVSTVIWVIMGAGGALLFLTIVVRLFRRVRRRQAMHGPRLTPRASPAGPVRGRPDGTPSDQDPAQRSGLELKA